MAVEQADSPDRLVQAVQALSASHCPDAIPTLIAALGYNNPGAAIAAVQGLVALGDCAVSPLLEQLDGYNYGARAYAIRALAGIGHPDALAVLIKAAETDFAPSVRRAALKGLGRLRWAVAGSAPNLAAASAALATLVRVATDEDWSLRYAAIVGLEALATTASQADLAGPGRALRLQVWHCLRSGWTKEQDQAVQARIQLAWQRLSAFDFG